jgi:V/A-type H+-transporting ATPase subunit E
MMSGTEKIIDMIHEKAEEEKKEILAEAENEQRIRLDVAQKKAEEKTKAIISKAQSELKAELDRYESSAKLKVKQKILQAKESLIQDVLEASREKLKKRVSSKKYEEDLVRLIVDGVSSLEGDEFELVYPRNVKTQVTAADAKGAIEKELGRKTKISISKDTLRSDGGVVVRTSDAERWVDNTIEARMERLEADIRYAINKVLFPEDS